MGPLVPFLLENPDRLWHLVVLETHFHLFFPLQEGQVVPWDPEGLEDPSHRGVQERRILLPLSVQAHQALPVRPSLQESPWVPGLLHDLVVRVFPSQSFQLGRGSRVALVGPVVLVNQPVPHLLLVQMVLSPLVFLGVLANPASQWPMVPVVRAALALLGVRDFRDLVFLVVQMGLGALEVQRGLVGQEYLALLLQIHLRNTPDTHAQKERWLVVTSHCQSILAD